MTPNAPPHAPGCFGAHDGAAGLARTKTGLARSERVAEWESAQGLPVRAATRAPPHAPSALGNSN
eukprot:scaffold11946_cov60-Phaeocystis_antarctica.AAC.3